MLQQRIWGGRALSWGMTAAANARNGTGSGASRMRSAFAPQQVAAGLPEPFLPMTPSARALRALSCAYLHAATRLNVVRAA